MLMQCPGCPLRFLYRYGKAYHSEACRRQHGHTKKAEQDHQLWIKTAEFVLPSQLRNLDPYASVQAVLEGHQKAGAKFYRLGCPGLEAHAGAKPQLRWFPPPTVRANSLFSIAPYEEPAVPFPGPYLIALFGAQHELLYEPFFKLPICTFNQITRWYMGTRRIDVRKADLR